MPEFVEVKVRVDKTQLTALRTEIEQIKGAGIDVKINMNGAGAATNSMKAFSAATKEAGERSALLDDVLKNARWYYISGLVSGLTRALKEAIFTMKEVDSALVAIQKTTDYSEAQIDALTKKTYELASAYGRTADELLNLSATFARAGYGDQLEEMTELAALLQNVGDIEGETASKFLLAANAAWQLGGDYDALMQIIDGMNQVTNKAAVDMQALAEGITVSASVFANAGESAQTYTALVGTAVAATQRSGSEIARGLRTISMRVRQVKGELDDGEIIDEEAISNAAKALYSVDVSVADANGQLRLTSDILAELAGKWASLSTAEQSYLADALAGKRQANILTALMQNWDEVDRQMELYANGAGSALRENELYLDSWEAKSKQLSATWTEFISHLIDSDVIKGGLDTLTGFIDALDGGFGHLAVTAGVAGVALYAIFSHPVIAGIAGLIALIGTLNAKHKAHEEALRKEYKELYSLKDAIDEVNEALQATEDAYNKAAGEAEASAERAKIYAEMLQEATVGSDEYNAILSNLAEIIPEVRDYIDEETGALNLQSTELDALIERWKQYALQQAATEKYSALYSEKLRLEAEAAAAKAEYDSMNALREATQRQIDDLISQLEATQYWQSGGTNHSDEELYIELLTKMVALRDDEIKGLTVLTQKTGEYKDTLDSAMAAVDGINAEIAGLDETIRDTATATDASAGALDGYKSAAYNAAKANEALQKAFDEVDQKGSLTYGTLKELDALYPGLSAKILDANGNLTAEGAAAMSSRAALYELISSMITANTTALNFDAQIAALQQLATEAGVAAGAISAVFAAANMGAAGTGDWDEIANMTPDQVARYRASSASNSMLALIRNQIKDQEYVGGGGGGGGGGGSKEEDPAEAELNRLKAVVELRKQELNLLKESGAEQSSIEAKQREIQDALHAQAEFLRSTEEYQITLTQAQEDSSKLTSEQVKLLNEAKSLSTEWWKIENDIIDAQEKIAKQLREDISDAIADIGEALENASDAMVDPLQAQLDVLTAAHDETEARREEEEKIAAVQEKQIELEKARIALENAQRERTVRQYNSRTGRWEWVANAKNLEAAQENLENAQKALIDAQTDLAKYYADQAYEAQKAVLEKQIKATKEAFASFRDTIKEASDAVKNGEMDIDEAYDYISREMKRIYDEYGIDLTDTLIDIISGFGEVSGAIGQLYSKILEMLGAEGKEGKGDQDGGGKSEKFIGAMSNIYFDARERGDADTMAAANRAANEERGMGSVITAVEDVALVSAQSSGKTIADYSADYIAARAAGDYSAMEVANRAANILRGNGNVVTAGDDINKVRTEGGYDYGGILTGMGGIKATPEDEMILPPAITRTLLQAEASGAFDALLNHLNIVTAAGNDLNRAIIPSQKTSNSTIGTQNVNPVFLDGVELKNITMGTTIGEIAQKARILALHTGS